MVIPNVMPKQWRVESNALAGCGLGVAISVAQRAMPPCETAPRDLVKAIGAENRLTEGVNGVSSSVFTH